MTVYIAANSKKTPTHYHTDADCPRLATANDHRPTPDSEVEKRNLSLCDTCAGLEPQKGNPGENTFYDLLVEADQDEVPP